MSARTTAEIVKDLLEWDDAQDDAEFPVQVTVHREAADRLTELDAERNEWEMHARRLFELVKTLVGREPQPGDGPDYHADHRAWLERIGPALANPAKATVALTASIEQLVATYNAVTAIPVRVSMTVDPIEIAKAKGHNALRDHLRSVKPS